MRPERRTAQVFSRSNSVASAARPDRNLEVPYIKCIRPYVQYLVYIAMLKYVCRSICCILSLLIRSPDIHSVASAARHDLNLEVPCIK